MARPTRVLPAVALALGAVLLTTGAAEPKPKVPPGSNSPGVHILNQDKGENGPACPQGWVCVFNGVDYRWGSFAVLPGTETRDIGHLRFTRNDSLEGQVSSWVNNSPVRYCWYEGTGFAGAEHRMEPFSKDRAISPDGTLSSFKPC